MSKSLVGTRLCGHSVQKLICSYLLINCPELLTAFDHYMIYNMYTCIYKKLIIINLNEEKNRIFFMISFSTGKPRKKLRKKFAKQNNENFVNNF